MWRGTSSWQRTVQPVKVDCPGKSAGRQAREDSRASERRARLPRGGPRAAGASSSEPVMVRRTPGRSTPAPLRVRARARLASGDGAGYCADQEKSKCSPGIPDTRGVLLCPEGECEGKNGVQGYSVALRAFRRSCEQSTQCRR
jgi:hypothetical protein